MAKKPSPDLFFLIKSLSRNEKGYFKKYVSRHTLKGENNYVRLFDAIDKQKKYDEEKILRKERYIRQLPLLKNYLYQMILESLENFYSKSRVNIRLYNMITRIQILHNKALYDQCHKLVRQVKKMAYRFDEFSVLLEALKWEKNLLGSELTFRKLDDIIREERMVQNHQQQVNQLQNASLKLYGYYKQYGILGKDAGSKKLKPLMDEVPTDENQLQTFTAKLYYLQIQGFYHYIMGDWAQSFEFTQQLVQHCEENPGYVRENPSQYILAINHVLAVSSRLNRKDDFFMYLNKLRAITEVIPDTDTRINKGRIFAGSHNVELKWYIMRGEFDKAAEIVHTFEEGIKEYSDLVNHSLVLVNMFNIAFIHFGAGQFEKALEWIRSALEEHKIENSSPQLDFRYRLLKLMILFDSQQYSTLESEVKQAFRHAYTKTRTYRLELFILDFIRRLAKTGGNKEQCKEACQYFLKEMPTVKDDSYEKALFEGFDFISWVNSHLEDRPYAITIRERAALAD